MKKSGVVLTIIVIICAFLVGFAYFKLAPISGKALLDIYIEQMNSPSNIMEGNLKLSLRQGELIPMDSLVVITQNGDKKEIPLRDLVGSSSEGNYFIENGKLSGSGEGYGFEGEKIIYPDVHFTFSLSEPAAVSGEDNDSVATNETSSENSEENNSIVENQTAQSNENSENSETQTQEETSSEAVSETTPVASETTQEVTQETTQEAAPETSSETESATSDSSLTGNAVAGEIIEGVVSKDKPYEYVTNDDISIENVYSDYEKLSPSVLKISKANGKIVVSTDYSYSEKGFGSEFLGDKKTLEIPLDKLNVTPENGTLQISLVYNGENLADITKKLGDGGIIESLNSSVSQTSKNITSLLIVQQIQDISLAYGGNYSLNLGDYFANAESYSFNADNFSGDIEGDNLIITPENNFSGESQAEIVALQGNESIKQDFKISVSNENYSVQTKKYRIVINQPVKWHKKISVSGEQNVTIELPKEAENVSVLSGADAVAAESKAEQDVKNNLLTGEVSMQLSKKKGFFTKLWEKVFGVLTGHVVADISNDVQETGDSKVVDVQVTNDTLVEYYTPAPTADETDISGGKRVVISAPTELNYTDILAYSELDNTIPMADKGKMKIYHYNNDSGSVVKEEVQFDAYDLDEDGNIDYVEWVVPHLSEQVYDIIYDAGTSLMALWKGENDAGDSSGNNYNGTWTGTEQYSTGILGRAFNFSGSDYVSIPFVNSSDDHYTISVWIKPKASQLDYAKPIAYDYIQDGSWSDPFLSYSVTLATNSGNLNPYCEMAVDGNHIVLTSSEVLSTTDWSNIICQNNGTDVNLYVNGIFVNSASAAGSLSYGVANGNLTLGKGSSVASSGDNYKGLLDEVMIFNRALNDTEIANLYNAYKPSTIISDCGTISSAGNYLLNQSIGAGGDCLIINSSDVVIDGAGFTVTGNIKGNGLGDGSHDNGFNFNLTNINVTGNVTSNGADYGYPPGSGNGGVIYVTDSNLTNVYAVGGNWTTGESSSLDNGRSGGNVSFINSNVSLVDVHGSDGDQSNSFYYGGNGGNVYFDVCPTPKPVVNVFGGVGLGGNGADGTITPSDCHSLAPDGYPCTQDSECSSGYCTWYSSVCKTPGTLALGDYCDDSRDCSLGECWGAACTIILSPGEISSCGTITQPGVYTLTAPVSSSGTCFTIESDNVTLDGNGQNLNFAGSGDGVLINGDRNNITIENFAQIYDDSQGSSGALGIYFSGGLTDSTIYNNNIATAGRGISFALISGYLSNIAINNNIISSENDGIYFAQDMTSSGVTFSGNTITTNGAESCEINNAGVCYTTSPVYDAQGGSMDVDACGEIVSAGTYTLTAPVSSDGTCFTITADEVILDGNGQTLTFNSVSGDNQYGVLILGVRNNITVENFNDGNGVGIENAGGGSSNDFAIFADTNLSNSLIQNNNVNSYYASGIVITSNSSNNNFTSNNISAGTRGCADVSYSCSGIAYASTSTSDVLDGNVITSFGNGILYSAGISSGLINGNNISAGTVGVYLPAGGISDTNFTVNRILDSLYGIEVDLGEVSGSYFLDNYISSSSYGIEFLGGSDSNVFSGNSILCSGNAPSFDLEASATNNIIYSNTISSGDYSAMTFQGDVNSNNNVSLNTVSSGTGGCTNDPYSCSGIVYTLSSPSDVINTNTINSYGHGLSFVQGIGDSTFSENTITPNQFGGNGYCEINDAGSCYVPHIDISECTTISSAGLYILNQSIGAGGDCLSVQVNDVMIDCNGSSITGDVNASGVNPGDNGFTNLTLQNCASVGNIYDNGRDSDYGPYSYAGLGGSVTIIDSTTGSVSVNGGNWDNGNSAGTITIVSSNTGDLTANGGSGTSNGGNGGTVYITNPSTYGALSVTGGSGGYAGGANGHIYIGGVEPCNGNGVPSGESCSCYSGWYGDSCQYDLSVVINSPSNGEPYAPFSYPGFSATINAPYCFYSLDDASYSEYTCGNDPFGTPAEGNNIFYVKGCADELQTDCGSSGSVSFSYDSVPPAIVINSPVEGYQNSWAPSVDWGDATSCAYSYGGDSVSVDCANAGSDIASPGSDGQYTLYLTAYDSMSNRADVSVGFTLDSTAPLIDYGLGTPSDGETVVGDLVVDVSVVETNFANVSYNIYNESGLVASASSSDLNNLSYTFTGLAIGNYTFNATVYDLAGNSNSTLSRTVSVYPNCLDQCSECSAPDFAAGNCVQDCTISQDCGLNENVCNTWTCYFRNLTVGAKVYTGYNAEGNGNNLTIALAGNISFLSGSSVTFSGRDGVQGGNAGTVNISVPDLFDTRNAMFVGIGGSSSGDGLNGGNGGQLILNYRGLLGKFSDADRMGDMAYDNTPQLSAGSASVAGEAGQVVYNKNITCVRNILERDADITNDGVINNGDRIVTENNYNVVNGQDNYNSSYDINCDNKINIVEISREGWQWARGM